MNELKIIQILHFRDDDNSDLLGLGNDGVTDLFWGGEWVVHVENIRFAKEQGKLHDFEKKYNITIQFPEIEYCTDNAAMIAMAGYLKYKNRQISAIKIKMLEIFHYYLVFFKNTK